MVKIIVTKYGSEEDRTNQRNGIYLGEATTYQEFETLVGQGGPAFLGYSDEFGDALYYADVERQFGRTPHRYRVDIETGEG